MISLIAMLLGLESFLLMAAVFTYENKLKKLNSDYDELDAEFNEVYSSYCNMSELALQYKELAASAADSAEIYKDAYHNAQPIQYESSGWNTDSWKSMPEPLSKDEWNNKWAGVHGDPSIHTSPIYGHTPYTRDWHIKDKGFDPNFE